MVIYFNNRSKDFYCVKKGLNEADKNSFIEECKSNGHKYIVARACKNTSGKDDEEVYKVLSCGFYINLQLMFVCFGLIVVGCVIASIYFGLHFLNKI